MANSLGNKSSFARLYSAGKSFLFVRSPPIPKITITHGPAGRPASPPDFLPRGAITAVSLPFDIPPNPRFLFYRHNIRSSFSGGALHVAAELVAHCREQLCGELVFSARAKALVERGAQNGRRRRFVDGRLNGPASLA